MEEKIYKVFMTGYSTQRLTNKSLNESLKGKIKGLYSAAIPSKFYQGYAFIEVKGKKALQKLLKKKHVLINGERFLIKPYKKGRALGDFKASVNDRKVFIHNIPASWENEALFRLFSRFGEVEDAFICVNNIKEAEFRQHQSKSKEDRRIGFVVFYDKRHAEEVCKMERIYHKNEMINVEPALFSKNTQKKANSQENMEENQRVHFQNDMNNDFHWRSKEGNYTTPNYYDFRMKEWREKYGRKNIYPQGVQGKQENDEGFYFQKKSHNGSIYQEYHYYDDYSQNEVELKKIDFFLNLEYEEQMRMLPSNWSELLRYHSSKPTCQIHFFLKKHLHLKNLKDCDENYRINELSWRKRKELEKRKKRKMSKTNRQNEKAPYLY